MIFIQKHPTHGIFSNGDFITVTERSPLFRGFVIRQFVRLPVQDITDMLVSNDTSLTEKNERYSPTSLGEATKPKKINTPPANRTEAATRNAN